MAKSWDLKEYTCMQTIILQQPVVNDLHAPEHGTSNFWGSNKLLKLRKIIHSIHILNFWFICALKIWYDLNLFVYFWKYFEIILGAFPIALEVNETSYAGLYLACNDYLVHYTMGKPPEPKMRKTHKTQLCSAIYNSLYKQVNSTHLFIPTDIWHFCSVCIETTSNISSICWN